MERTLSKRSRFFSRQDLSLKYAVLLFVLGVFNSLPSSFPNVYRKKTDQAPKSDQNGWIDIIIALADGKTDDRSLDRIYKSNVYNVFFGLEYSARQYYKMKQEHPELFKNSET